MRLYNLYRNMKNEKEILNDTQEIIKYANSKNLELSIDQAKRLQDVHKEWTKYKDENGMNIYITNMARKIIDEKLPEFLNSYKDDGLTHFDY